MHFFRFRRTNILLPKVMVPGQITKALVHFHRQDERHNVTLRLIRPTDKFDGYKTRTDILAQNTATLVGKLKIAYSTTSSL